MARRPLCNPYGLDEASMALVQQALDESAPLTDDQIARCAVLLELVPVSGWRAFLAGQPSVDLSWLV